MVAKLLDTLSSTLLMGPGPSCVPQAVYDALGMDTIGHLDPRFIAIMDEIKTHLRKLLQTQNELTIPISGTGSAGMETSFVNLIEPGDRILVLQNGVFGQRMQDLATRLGAEVDVLEFPWGTPVETQRVEKQLAGTEYKLVAVVHAETSTGVANPVAEIGRMVKNSDALYLVDCVTSLGGMEVCLDQWHVDVAYSGTQKCLSCPPGLSPVSLSDRAVSALQSRKRPVPNWYLDLNMIINYWAGETRAYHHTAPINMLYGLYASLNAIADEGMEQVFARHLRVHHQLVESLEKMGLSLAVEEHCRLPMLNAVLIPAGVNDAQVRSRLLKEFDIEIGGGLGVLAGKIWRIGLMGHTAREENVERFLSSLSQVLQ